MRQFFCGWRRKAGVVTLLLACLLAGLWIRTMVVVDRFSFSIGHRAHILSSDRGGLWWMSLDQPPTTMAWYAVPVAELEKYHLNKSFIEVLHERFEQFSDIGLNPTYRFVLYRWLIPPLTLLSVYLMLWNGTGGVPNSRGSCHND